MGDQYENDSGVATDTKSDQKTKRPRMYKALMHNDDYTTREFVVFVLETIFHKNEQDAVKIMLHVHNNGVGLAGVFTREIAETKIAKVERLARQEGFPLRMSIEPVEED